MTEVATDDKVQAVVGLVLQAVDQRLSTVRDQLVQLANTMHRSHAELGARIDECRQLAAAGGSGTGVDPGASKQLVEIANLLTDRVAQLEARFQQYADDRIAEMVESLRSEAVVTSPSAAPVARPAAATPVASPVAVSSIASNAAGLPDAVARLGSLVPGGQTAPISQPVAVQPLVSRVAHTAVAVPAPQLSPAEPVAAAAPAPTADGAIDIEALSAQMSQRLAALVDKALSS